MRRSLWIILLLVIPCLAGCCAYDVLFGVFGDYYSGGGTTFEESGMDILIRDLHAFPT